MDQSCNAKHAAAKQEPGFCPMQGQGPDMMQCPSNFDADDKLNGADAAGEPEENLLFDVFSVPKGRQPLFY